MKENTYRREKEIIVSIVSMILIMGFYALYVYNKYIEGNPGIVSDFSFWGKAILVMMPVMIVAQIIIHIIFFIINKILTNEDIPFLNDEMDKMIELKAMRVSHWTLAAGFILAMVAMAFGMQPWWMFIIWISSGFLGSIAEGIVKIIYYRRGF